MSAKFQALQADDVIAGSQCLTQETEVTIIGNPSAETRSLPLEVESHKPLDLTSPHHEDTSLPGADPR